MKKKEELVIGILGGMGTYATIHMFEQYAEVFPAKKEWDRPRIIIDNRCTMPSRVRAFLYNENKDELISEMAESLVNLKKAGANKIICACNTSHLFLPYIFDKVKNTELEEAIENIIDNCVEQVEKDNEKKVYLLATEGTIDSKIYQEKFIQKNVVCETPSKEEYLLLRECIEAVKQNCYTEDIRKIFLSLLDGHQCIVLGCTEFPILYDRYKNEIIGKKIYDPVMITLRKIKVLFG